ncbi:MAG: polysaccharide lyase 8 family protein [Bacteroides sp.]|nr:polysaccharide lyase 8 family protein [Bacteroides sp.]
MNLQKNICSLLFCLVSYVPLTAQVDQEIAHLKKNYISSILGADEQKKAYLELLSSIPKEAEVSDQNVIELQQLYPITKREVQVLIRTIREDGSWPDINYADTKRSGWEPKRHVERVLKLVKYYYPRKEQSKQVSELVSTIHKAMNYWFTQKLVCKNWWYNQIGIPRTMGTAFLLFESEMDEQEKQAAVEVLLNAKFGMTGQNKVWLAGNVLMRALLQNDLALVKAARDEISSEIVLGRIEGIKPDWSFHQHGPQQQFGNYGLSFIGNMSFYSELFAGTSLAFNAEQQRILVSLLLNGYRWIVWRGYWDVNALNRQLFHSADIHKSFNLLFAANSLMKGSSPEEVTAIKAFAEANFLDAHRENRFVGNKHFDDSDLTIHRTPSWMASVRMASDRVIGVEQVNEDNLQGYYMADGAIYIYARGDEYHNIFPFWNWRRIPGITTYESLEPIPNANSKGARNHSSLVGGVSDGKQGITAMVLNRNGLTAHKSWVFTDEYVLCMGSNIHSDSTAAIVTSIDQRLAKGSVRRYPNQRFYHDHTGYIVLQADSCVVETERREGRWCDVMGMYKPKILENDVFSIYIKHRQVASSGYEYMLLPATTPEKVQAFDTTKVRILRNDEKVQAVVIGDSCFMAIYQKTDLQLENGITLHFEEPGTYIAGIAGGEVTVAAPFRQMKK